MIDLVLLAILVALVVRGWSRGFVRQALDVATLLVGAALAFRLAPVLGRLLTDALGWSPELARVAGGVALFLLLSIGAGFASSAIHRSMKRLPGTSLFNSIAGAALGGVYAMVLAVAAVTLLSALPLPAAVAAEFDESMVAERVIDPDGPAQKAVQALSGDRAVQSMIWLRRLAGEWLFVASEDEQLVLPVGDDPNAQPSSRAAEAVVAAIDEARDDDGLEPLEWTDELAVVAVARAGTIYRTGSFDSGVPLDKRLDAVGVFAGESTERLLLAPSVEGVERAIDFAGSYDEAGIGVVDGPYGLLTVLVLVSEA